MEPYQIAIAGLVLGYLLDLLFGDPARLPHPVVLFGKLIAHFEKTFNIGRRPLWMGGFAAAQLVVSTYLFFYLIMRYATLLPDMVEVALVAIFVFYGLANRTLVTEVRNVFVALEKDIDSGRKALSRIVGRDTGALNNVQIRKAALETLAENLSDGVVAPLFYYALLGVPGMMAYKMVNTLDSMWGYKNTRYLLFGRFAARMDDVANFIPARLTAVLMATVSLSIRGFVYIKKYGSSHTSPNSGYPEAALAGILNCQFGGGSYYGGVYHRKPTLGDTDRLIFFADMVTGVRVNHKVTLVSVLLIVGTLILRQ